MKVLFLNRVFPPAEGATGQLLAELANGLTRAGWEVTVVTSRLDHRTPRSEVVNGMRVERVGGLPFTRATFWRRAMSYLTLYPALIWRALRLPRPDVVVTLTDPPLHLVLGPILKWTKGCRLVHWAQDVYPEVAEELGVLRRGGLLAGFCRSISTRAMKRHDRVAVVGHCMKRRLEARGLAASAFEVIPNWAPAASMGVADAASGAESFRREHGLKQRFVVMYSGNLGLAHPFGSILAAAEELRTRRPEMLFLFVGAGPQLASVRQQADARRLDNIRFLPPQAHGALAHSLGAADVHLASMHDRLRGLVVPSKVYGILAAGRPCVFLGPHDSEAAHTIESQACGEVIEAATGPKLAACLMAWADDPWRLAEAGLRARRFAGISGLDSAVECFERLLREVCAPQSLTTEPRPAAGDFTPQQMPSSTPQ